MTIEEQLSLFKEYFSNNDIEQANLIIKNLFNKNIDNLEVFQTFYEFSIKIAKWNIDLSTRNLFLEQAASAVIFFSENAVLTRNNIEYIHACQREVEELRADIVKVEHIQQHRHIEEAQKDHAELLLKLTEYKYKIGRSNTQAEFNEFLEGIRLVEDRMDADLLTYQDKELYKELTIEYPTVINQKLNEFEVIKGKEYNKKAVRDFNHVFNEFKQYEEKYRTNRLELKRLVATRLFSYDAGQLFNETLIYYNHVYSYIFGKLDEDSKFRLTELAIEAEKVGG